jgi:SAM-dependent methyltransferase
VGADEPVNRWLAGDGIRGDDYDRRFRAIEASGVDVHGEAALICSFHPRSVLDAGCGTGRVAIELARRGLDVVGADLDPAMLTSARAKAPELTWVEADLATLTLGRTFDLVVMAGNVMIFTAPGSEGAVLARIAQHLVPGGLVVAGFTLGPLPIADYDRLAALAGLEALQRWSTWTRAPFTDSSGYAVSVHRRTEPGDGDG